MYIHLTYLLSLLAINVFPQLWTLLVFALNEFSEHIRVSMSRRGTQLFNEFFFVKLDQN